MDDIRKGKNPHAIIDVAKMLGVSDFRKTEELVDKIKELSKEEISDIAVYGTTTEIIFQKMVASISWCKMIKKEDEGSVLTDETIRVPDYRLVTKNGTNILVEVKNCNNKENKKVFTKEYIDSLLKYCELCKTELKIAIFWNKFGIWSLNSIEDSTLNRTNTKYSITITDAAIANDTRLFGDLVIGLKPGVTIRFNAKKISEKRININSKTIEASISGIEVIYDGKTIEEPKAKSLLIFFMFYGTWDYKENTVVKSDKELYIDYIFTQLENQNKGFGIIGSLSSIITRYYKSICYGEDGKKINITPKLMRIDLSPIFEYNKTKTIPLWIFAVTKN